MGLIYENASGRGAFYLNKWLSLFLHICIHHLYSTLFCEIASPFICFNPTRSVVINTPLQACRYNGIKTKPVPRLLQRPTQRFSFPHHPIFPNILQFLSDAQSQHP
jgi:hypothetical protein